MTTKLTVITFAIAVFLVCNKSCTAVICGERWYVSFQKVASPRSSEESSGLVFKAHNLSKNHESNPWMHQPTQFQAAQQ